LFYYMYGSKLQNYNYNMLNEAQGNFTFTCDIHGRQPRQSPDLDAYCRFISVRLFQNNHT